MRDFSEREGTNLNVEELIVVEGKNDAHAIRRALGKVDVIWTEGFGLTPAKLAFICEMAKRKGVIVCTDPDNAGSVIRRRILSRVPEAKQVYLSRKDALGEKGDIGLENVSLTGIRQAFSKVLQEKTTPAETEADRISFNDMLESGLAGTPGSRAKRAALGKALGLGDTNVKQFLFRAGRFGLGKKEFYQALQTIERTEK